MELSIVGPICCCMDLSLTGMKSPDTKSQMMVFVKLCQEYELSYVCVYYIQWCPKCSLGCF